MRVTITKFSRLIALLGVMVVMLPVILISQNQQQNLSSHAAGTTLVFTVFLHGIGKGGDSANALSGGNANPVRTQRILSVGVFNAQNVLVTSKSIPATYNSTTGNFTGTGDFGTLASGPYTVTIRADMYLQQVVPGIQTITSGQTKQIPPVYLISGDIDTNNQINIADFNSLMGCYSDLTAAKSCTSQQKTAADITDDGSVNQLDYNLFIREIGNRSGAGNPTVMPSAGATQTPPTVTPPTVSSTAFPRLGGMLIGSPQNYDQTSYQQQIAKLDLAVLGMYPGWNRGGKTPSQAVNQIKAINAKILLANYTIMTEVNNSASDTSTAPWRAQLVAQKGPNGVGDWWAYNAAGQHTDWSGGAYGGWDTNLTLLTTPDANGDHWPQWKAKYDYQSLYQGVNFDFWYSDNNMWKPRIDADWNRDGKNDSQDSVATRNWWRDGEKAYYDTAKSTAHNLPMMVNADNDLDGTVFPSGADHFTQFKNEVGEAFIEHAMGKDWSAETWSGWSTVMNWYRHLKANLIAPQVVVFDVYVPNVADYQYLRYAFASCLMDDGYFSASTDYNQIVWFDEYDLAGTSNTKWLGKAIDGPRTSAWQNGVYRRNFEHGTVLVNPKGNGAKTVTIEAGYHRFLGRQAPNVNNGQQAASVTLSDRDGIFLVKN
jgi:hypothetical protein